MKGRSSSHAGFVLFALNWTSWLGWQGPPPGLRPGLPLHFSRGVKVRRLCRAHTHRLYAPPWGKWLWLICHLPGSAPPWVPQLTRPAPSHSHFPQGLMCQGGRVQKGFYTAASVPHWLSATILSLCLHSGPWNEGDFNLSWALSHFLLCDEEFLWGGGGEDGDRGVLYAPFFKTIYLAVPCSMLVIVPWSGIEPAPPALKAQGLNC